MKAKLDRVELDLVDEALIVLGAFLMKTGRNEEAQKVTEIIKKFQIAQTLSPIDSVTLEPLK